MVQDIKICDIIGRFLYLQKITFVKVIKLGAKKWAFLLFGAFFLLSSLLPGFTEQLNKLPSLVHHYRHHVIVHNTVNFSEFIEEHYGKDNDHKHAENHDDLPLFHINGSVVLVLVQEFTSFTLQAPMPLIIEHPSFECQAYSFQKLGGIFQPPRAI